MARGNFVYKRLGDRVIKERKLKSLSQEQLALLCGIDRTYIARIEEGKANPSIRVLYKISRVLKTKIQQLVEGL
jgi:transcriptional regulator with XRE-family HTH domain